MKQRCSMVRLLLIWCILSAVASPRSIPAQGGPSTDCSPPASGMVAWWKAEANALDSAGTNNASSTYAVTYVPGEVSNAFYFEATNYSAIEVPNSPSLVLTNELTIEFWVRRLRLTYPSTPYADYIVEKGGDWTAGVQNYAVGLQNANYGYCLHMLFAGGWRGAGSITDTNSWHHCAVTARNGETNPVFYIDGVQQPVIYSEGASTINLYPSVRPLHIGAQLDPVSGWYYYSEVMLDELSLYNRVLSPQEIQAIYNAGSAGKCVAPQPPVIVGQPADTTVAAGGIASFVVYAQGANPLFYQWFFGTNLLTGATGPMLSLSNVQPDKAGTYSVLVSNQFGTVISSNATLTVLTYRPSIITQPQSTNVYVGGAVALSVRATGTLPLAYVWQKDGTAIPGATGSVYTLTNVQLTNAGVYSVTVTNLYGSTNSSDAHLAVLPPPPCTPAPPDMIAWWRGENNTLDSCDDQNGVVPTADNVTYGPGEVGRAMNFGGAQYVFVPDSPTLHVTNAFSIEAWVYPAAASSSVARTIMARFEPPVPFYPLPNTQTNSSFWLGTTNNGVLCLTICRNGVRTNSLNLLHPMSLPAAQWSFVVATYDGAALQLYINGALVAHTNYAGGVFPGTTDLGIGDIPTPGYPSANGYWPWVGMLDEISVYRRALTPDEIQVIYSAAVSGKCLLPPLITVQPQSQAVPLGEDVLFAPTVLGSKPLYYRWSFNGNYLPGATNSTLLLEKIQTNRAGNYAVQITNSVGAVLSSNALLTLLPPPSCMPPATNLVSWWPGDSSYIDAVGTNNITSYINVTLQTGKVVRAFSFNGVNSRASIANSPSLNFGTNAAFSIEGWIKVVSTNVLGVRVPLSDTMTILEKRTFSPIFLPVDSGYAVYLYRGRLAFWSGPSTYLPPRLSIATTFISPGPDLRDGMFHHVAISYNRSRPNGGNLYVDGQLVLNFDAGLRLGTLSNTAPLLIGASATGLSTTNSPFSGLIDELTLYNRDLSAAEILAIRQAGAAGKCKAPPFIITQPQRQIVNRGGTANFSVAAGGTPTLKYQWRLGAQNLPGATGSSLTISNVQTANAGSYFVLVSNGFGSVLSSNAQLVVNLPPVARCTNVTVNAGSNCMAGASIDNGSYDPEGGPITLYQLPPGPYSLGYTPVTLVAVDAMGASNICMATVRVIDGTPPTISAPAAIIATNDLNQCGAVVNFPFPTANDNCSAVNVTCAPMPGTFFPVGTTAVKVTAYDAAYNVTNYYFNVTVRDTQLPTITCPANVSVTNAHDAWTSVVTYDVNASDNCPGVSQPICSPPSGAAFGIGDNTVTCSAIDAAGNASHCTFTVTVHSGNVPPVPLIDISPLARFPGYTNLIVIAPNNTSASVVFDGSRSYDVDDTNFNYFWYDGTNVFSTDVVARETLTVGSHAITLWLDDTYPLGTNATSATLEVITPGQAVGIVMGMLQNANLGSRNMQPLFASLNAAVGAFDRGNLTAAINQLSAFKIKVQSQIAPTFPGLANELLMSTQVIIDAVTGKAADCGGRRSACQ